MKNRLLHTPFILCCEIDKAIEEREIKIWKRQEILLVTIIQIINYQLFENIHLTASQRAIYSFKNFHHLPLYFVLFHFFPAVLNTYGSVRFFASIHITHSVYLRLSNCRANKIYTFFFFSRTIRSCVPENKKLYLLSTHFTGELWP